MIALKKLSKQSAPKKPKIIELKKKHIASSKSTKPLVHSLDYNNLAVEYESRQVEFGHGRKKSQEWNDEIAKSIQIELRGRRKKTRLDRPFRVKITNGIIKIWPRFMFHQKH